MKLTPIVVSIALFGCLDSAPPGTEAEDLTAICPAHPNVGLVSLVDTQPAVLAKFGFTRTLQQIIDSAHATASITPKVLYQNWMATFGPSDCTNPNVDPQHFHEVCPRPEQALATIDPTDPASPIQFRPVAVFDRFDLAPKSGANCGEYRIVYAMNGQTGPVFGRAFYIFEAALPNPRPKLGIAGCLPIAQWWADRSNDKDEAMLATNLEKFFYLGTAIPGVPAVVDAAHYGLGQGHASYTSGQIRSNMFIQFQQWNLREFKTDLACNGACTLSIDHVTAKDNPANELFDGTSSLAAGFAPVFAQQARALAATDVSNIGMAIPDIYNEYESVSQGSNAVLYDQFADTTITSAVTSELHTLGITNITATQLFRRASTQTCAGCHQLSTGSPENALGGGLTWPQSLVFTQVDEQSRLSPALQNFFLPHRMLVIDDFLCTAASLTDDGLTLGGSTVGAPN